MRSRNTRRQRRGDPCRARRDARYDAGRAVRAPFRARHCCLDLVAVAVLSATRDHAEKKTGHAVEQDRPDVLKRRLDWFDGQLDLDPDRLVFIDETWTATNMTRSHGRCRKGERLRMGYPHGHRKTTTLVAGLRKTGMVAPMTLDGPINGDWFEAYVRHVLIPTLRPGDVVIMDNLSSHKRASVREMIEAAGARLLFLPPYSPDFNPDRDGLRQAQGAAQEGRRAHRRWSLEHHRQARRLLHAHKNARTTSPPADTMQIDRKTL